ncbi:MAG TPA: twin-arginine translocase TatA/TatE family subunit [Terriglobales bacterium]|nr:twin-arginine translocase TatA/TatE family subunit [Terriglobales bacterium]
MNFGFSGEMIFLFFLALILFGPKKLPEMGRQIGRLMNEFRRASNEFRSQIESEINAVESNVKPQILPPLKEPLGAIASRIFNPPAGAEAPKPEPATTPPTKVETGLAPSPPAGADQAATSTSLAPKVAPDA